MAKLSGFFLALSRRRREANPSAPSLGSKHNKKRKLPGFKGFGRSSSTTQLVDLGGIGQSASVSSTVVEEDSSWRIEPVPPVIAAATTTPLPDDAPVTAAPNATSCSSDNARNPCPPASLAVAKCWYLATHAALALFPFPAIYLSDRGLSSVEIGMIMALRPFTSAVAGNAWALLADATCSHRAVLLSTFIAAGVARGLVGLPVLKTFWPLLAAVLFSEAVAAPVIILADAATQQAAEAAGSNYGRVRLFGAVGLGAFSPLNGLLVTRFGNGAGFLAGAAAWLSASCLTAMLPVAGLSAAAARGQRPAGRRAASEAGGSSCCGGHLPLPAPLPGVALVEEEEEEEEEASEVEEDGEAGEEEQVDGEKEGRSELTPGSSSSGSASSASVVEVEAVAAAGIGPGEAAAAVAARFGGTATTRARLPSHGGAEAGSRSVAFSSDGGGAAAAVAAAAAALGPSSPSPRPLPPPPALRNALVVLEAFARSESGDGEHRGRSRGSPSPAPSSVAASSASTSGSTRPLSPGVAAARGGGGRGGGGGGGGGGGTISSLTAAALPSSLPPVKRRTSSSTGAAARGDSAFDASSLPLHRKIAAVFGSPRAALFFATAWSLGYGAGTIDSWLFVFLEEPPLRASKQLMGVTILVTCATEVPAFFFAGRLIDRFGSGRVLSVVALVLAGRLAGYWALPSITHNPWAVLPLETLNGVTFGCGWAAGTARAAGLAPPGLAATAQAAFAAVYGGLGVGLGSLAGGVVRSKAGGKARWVFAAAAAVIALAWVATAVAEALVKSARRRRRRRSGSWRRGGGRDGRGLGMRQRKGFQRWPPALPPSVLALDERKKVGPLAA